VVFAPGAPIPQGLDDVGVVLAPEKEAFALALNSDAPPALEGEEEKDANKLEGLFSVPKGDPPSVGNGFAAAPHIPGDWDLLCANGELEVKGVGLAADCNGLVSETAKGLVVVTVGDEADVVGNAVAPEDSPVATVLKGDGIAGPFAPSAPKRVDDDRECELLVSAFVPAISPTAASNELTENAADDKAADGSCAAPVESTVFTAAPVVGCRARPTEGPLSTSVSSLLRDTDRGTAVPSPTPSSTRGGIG